jgi:hypothetical protein
MRLSQSIQHFPNDENGRVLRRMYDGGDDLTQSRVVDFCFVFPDRAHALAFVRDVADQTLETCLSWYQGKSMWQIIVKRDMVPEHASITAMESTLTLKANQAGGKADGWGCMQIPKQDGF